MKILDFFMYYFSRWLEFTDRRKKKATSYPDQSAYALTISLGMWIEIVDFVTEYFLFGTYISKIPLLLLVVVSMSFYFLLRYIYITKRRYDQILKMSDPKFSISEKAGRIIALIIFFFPFPVLVFVALLLHHII